MHAAQLCKAQEDVSHAKDLVSCCVTARIPDVCLKHNACIRLGGGVGSTRRSNLSLVNEEEVSQV